MDSKTYLIKTGDDEPGQLLLDITALEMRANKMGLFPCARALNNAKNAAGWQMAGNIEQADAASTHRN